MKKLGVIGGLGPMATAFFMQMVIEMTEAHTDQEHIEMLIHNCPSIPDRTSYILGNIDDDPGKPMAEIGKQLVANGAEVIAIPCITASYFLPELYSEIRVPIINIIKETTQYLTGIGIQCVGLMATNGTIQSNLFQDALCKAGLDVILPKQKSQEDIMHLIYNNIKASKQIEMDRFERASAELKERGAQVIVLGCTELSLIRRDMPIGEGYLDAMQVLAKCSVEQCGVLKKEYNQLITKKKKV